MKVLIICQEPFPRGKAASRRICCYAKALIREGIQSRVLVYKRTEKSPSPDSSPEGSFEGVPFKYMGRTTLKPTHKIERILAEYSDKAALRRYLRKNLREGDAVFGYVNSDRRYISSLIDLIHSKGAKYVRELCEIPYFGNNAAARDRLLAELFPKCDGFIAISEPLRQIALRFSSANVPILKLPILVEMEKAVIQDRSDSGDIPFIFHCGTLLDQKDGIVGLIEAFAAARKRCGGKLRLICTGEPSESPDFRSIDEALCRNDVRDDVVFLGYVSEEVLHDYLSRSTLAVINKYDNEQNRYCFSTKLGEYLAAGKAVITTDVGEAVRYLENGRSAIIVRSGDTAELCDAIVRVVSDRNLRSRLGSCGRQLCSSRFDYRSLAPELAGFVKSLH